MGELETALAIAIDRVKENVSRSGDTVADGFIGNTRSLGVSNLEEGDIFIIPENYQVMNSSTLTSKNGPVQYTIVPLVTENGVPTGAAKQLFPSAFQTTVRWYKESPDGLPMYAGKYEVSEGEPVRDFIAHKEIKDGINALVGKKIRVVRVITVHTRDFNDKTKFADRSVYVFEYVA